MFEHARMSSTMLGQIALYPPRASTTAEHVDQLFFFLLGVTMAAGLLVAILMIAFAIQLSAPAR